MAKEKNGFVFAYHRRTLPPLPYTAEHRLQYSRPTCSEYTRVYTIRLATVGSITWNASKHDIRRDGDVVWCCSVGGVGTGSGV